MLSVALLVRWRCQQQTNQNASRCQQGGIHTKTEDFPLSVALLVRWRCQQKSKNRGLFALRRVASKVEAPKNASGCQQGVNTSPNAEVFLLSVVLPARCQTQVAKKGQRSSPSRCQQGVNKSPKRRTFSSLSSCQQGVNTSQNAEDF